MRCIYWAEDVARVNLLIEILYNDLQESAGGLLHIVLDDGNLDDEDIRWCLDWCDREENKHRPDRLLCKRIANELLGLTMEQRRLVYYGEVGLKCKRDCDECPICQEED